MANYLIAFDCTVDKSPLYQHITVDNDVVADEVAWGMSHATGLSVGNYDLYREVTPDDHKVEGRTMSGARWIETLNDSGFCREDMQDLFCSSESELFTSRAVMDMVVRYEGGVYAHEIYKLMEACYGLDF